MAEVTNLRLVDGQVGAVGPLETLFIEEGQVVLCRQVLSLNKSAERDTKMSFIRGIGESDDIPSLGVDEQGSSR